MGRGVISLGHFMPAFWSTRSIYRDGSGVQFDDVAVLELVLASDVLAVEAGLAPHARIAERAREIAVHEVGDVFDGLPVA